MKSKAVVFSAPEKMEFREVELRELGSDDVLVETYWTSVSAGTEKMLFHGKLPPIPMMAYPVIPGYETVGKIIQCGEHVPRIHLNKFVYVPGSSGYLGLNSAFGGSSEYLISPFQKIISIDPIGDASLGLALPLGATALHAVDLAKVSGKKVLILGQGAVGLLVAEFAKYLGASLVVATDTNPDRLAFSNAEIRTSTNEQLSETLAGILCDVVIDCTGSMKAIQESLIHLGLNSQVVLAGYYQDLHLPYEVLFMKELNLIVAKQWLAGDLERVRDLIARSKINAKKIFTHHHSIQDGVESAYHTAFNNGNCLKMVLNWKED